VNLKLELSRWDTQKVIIISLASQYEMNLMFVFAHPDDESFSTGGTIAKYVSEGHNVYTVCFTSIPVRKKEFFTAMGILNVAETFIFDYDDIETHRKELTDSLISLLIQFRPEVLVTHLPYDYHRDHLLTYEIVREAIEWAAHTTQHSNAHLVTRLYSTETTVLIPQPHILVDISKYYLLKEKAMKCYKSQLDKGGEDFYIEFHRYRTLMRGVQAGCKYAEAFIQHPLVQSGPFYPKRNTDL